MTHKRVTGCARLLAELKRRDEDLLDSEDLVLVHGGLPASNPAAGGPLTSSSQLCFHGVINHRAQFPAFRSVGPNHGDATAFRASIGLAAAFYQQRLKKTRVGKIAIDVARGASCGVHMPAAHPASHGARAAQVADARPRRQIWLWNGPQICVSDWVVTSLKSYDKIEKGVCRA